MNAVAGGHTDQIQMFEDAEHRRARAEAGLERIVDFLGRGDALLDNSQGLTPQCVLHAVGDEAERLFAAQHRGMIRA